MRVSGPVVDPGLRSCLLRRTGHSRQHALRMMMVKSAMVQLKAHYFLRYSSEGAMSMVPAVF
jgi:hypothetical protein